VPTRKKRSPNKKRRGYGSGGVYYVESKKAWCAALSFGIDAKGRRVRKVFYAPSEKAAQQILIDARLRSGAELASRNRTTFSEYAAGWLAREVVPNRRPTTERYYRLIVDRYLVPTLGRKRMAEIGVADIEHAIAAAREMTSASMASKARGCARRIFGRAFTQGVIASNPVVATEPPRVVKQSMQFLTAEQLRKLFKAAQGDRMEALVVLLGTAGLRLGESLALLWADVDLDAGELRVMKTLQDNLGPLRIVEPKTAAGRRLISLGNLAIGAMRRRLEVAKKEGFDRPKDPIFPTTTGTHQRRKNLHDRFWKPLLKAAGLPPIRFHDLRHSSASLSLAAGTDARTLADRLGHSDAGFTLRTYAHSTGQLQRQDAAGIDLLLAPPPAAKKKRR
jgi:integrase